MTSDGEVTILSLRDDCSRCVSCRRLVTLRRILLHGTCKCGSVKTNVATFLDEDDLLEIEEDYGWNVRITDVGVNNVSKGLLPRGHSPEASSGSCVLEVDEARLHSREIRSLVKERTPIRRHLERARGFFGTPFSLFSPNPVEWKDKLSQLRKPSFFFRSRDA